MSALASRRTGIFRGRNIIILRASCKPYIILWGFLALIGTPFFIMALSGQEEGLITLGVIIFFGLIGTASLMCLQLTLSSETVSYRTLIRTVQIPLTNITEIHGVFGREKCPMFALLVEVASTVQSRQICVNMKLFAKLDLHDFLNAAEVLGVPVRIDGVVATRLKLTEKGTVLIN